MRFFHCAQSLVVLSLILVLVGPSRPAVGAPFAYTVNRRSNSVSVIDTETDSLVTTVPVGISPRGVAVHPNGKQLYISNFDSHTVTVIDAAVMLQLKRDSSRLCYMTEPRRSHDEQAGKEESA